MIKLESVVRGLEDLDVFFRTAPQHATTASVLAVNDAALFARRLSSKEIRGDINLTATYLNSNNRLAVVQRAARNDSDPEAIVRGRDRATSLARFTSGTPSFAPGKGRRGVRVKVSASGGGSVMRKAFFMRLRRGNAAVSDENSNIGLAVRVKRGERIPNKRDMVGVGGGLYLLYGPSVGQVFRNVAVDIGPQVSDKLSAEFVRQFERLIK